MPKFPAVHKRTARDINKALRAAGFKEQIIFNNHGGGYWYFIGGEHWYSSSVYVCYADGISMTDAEWIAERNRLAGA